MPFSPRAPTSPRPTIPGVTRPAGRPKAIARRSSRRSSGHKTRKNRKRWGAPTSNATSHVEPIGLAQLALHDLAGILAREGSFERNRPRHLEIGEASAQECLDLGGVEPCRRVRLDMRAELFAVLLVGNTEDRAIAYPRHREQSRFDLGRVDVDAAGDHHVAGAVADKEIAVLVEIADIAERDETVAPDLATLFVLAVVGEIRKPLEPEVDFADLARRQNPAVGAVDAHRAAGRWPSDGARLPQRFLGGVEGGDPGLGRAVIFVDDRPPPFDHRPLHASRAGGSAVYHPFER